MYDIYFDLNNMHQVVDDAPAEQLSLLYDELTKVSKAQQEHVQEFWSIGETFSFDFIDPSSGEELDDDDDFAVIVRRSNGCTCEHCGEIYPYAEPNKKDGGFKCWACRNF